MKMPLSPLQATLLTPICPFRVRRVEGEKGILILTLNHLTANADTQMQ